MAATLSESNVIEQEVRVNAPAQAIFPFFTDAQSIVRWMAVDATLDPRPGGVFRVNCPNELHVIEGRYLELEPPSRVVFTWGWKSMYGESVAPGSSTVEVDLLADGDATIVRVRHRELRPEVRSFHDMGWAHYLPRLAVAAAGGNPGIDFWAEAFR
jgi:uncharacterized protein YndB with AHSA1/START domain